MIITLSSNMNNASLQVGDYAFYIPANAIYDPSWADYHPSYSADNSLQIDTGAYYNGVAPIYIGVISAITANSVTIDNGLNGPMFHGPDPADSGVSAGAFLLFAKSGTANISGVKGYFSLVSMTNADYDRPVELFSISSEVSESSK